MNCRVGTGVRGRGRREARDKQGVGGGGGRLMEVKIHKGGIRVNAQRPAVSTGWQFYAISPQPREWGTEAPSVLKITFYFLEKDPPVL